MNLYKTVALIGTLHHKLIQFCMVERSLLTPWKAIYSTIKTQENNLSQKCDILNKQSSYRDSVSRFQEVNYLLGVGALPTRFCENSKELPRLKELLNLYWTDEELRPRLIATLEEFQRNISRWDGKTG